MSTPQPWPGSPTRLFRLIFACYVHQTYELHGKYRHRSTEATDVSGWQAEFQELMGAEAENHDVFNIKYLTARSISDALNESLSGELFLFVITCELMGRLWGGLWHCARANSFSLTELLNRGATQYRWVRISVYNDIPGTGRYLTLGIVYRA